METFKQEIRSIFNLLQGNPWATQTPVHAVIREYGHFVGAGKTPTQERRVSLQIFHASRAIDSLLAHIVQHESSKPGKPRPRNRTLGSSQKYIRKHGISGLHFTHTEDSDLDAIRNDRNTYLHQADCFPPDGVVKLFLNRTVRVLGAALRFPM